MRDLNNVLELISIIVNGVLHFIEEYVRSDAALEVSHSDMVWIIIYLKGVPVNTGLQSVLLATLHFLTPWIRSRFQI